MEFSFFAPTLAYPAAFQFLQNKGAGCIAFPLEWHAVLSQVIPEGIVSSRLEYSGTVSVLTLGREFGPVKADSHMPIVCQLCPRHDNPLNKTLISLAESSIKES